MSKNNRDKFEAWASDEGKFPFAVERSGDSYKFMATQNKWEVWQAATQSTQQQLTESQSKLEKMAAENAGLKDANTEGCKWDGEQWVGLSTETPATDAVLAEVRASGVEMLLSYLPPHYTARADIEKFAAQLRQGASEWKK